MTDKEKLLLADTIINFFKERVVNNDSPKFVGTLKKRLGLNGFKPAEEGTPVFEHKGRYVIFLESLDGKTNVELPYFKETLKPAINYDTDYKGSTV